MQKIIEKTYELAKPVVNELGLNLWDIEYKKEGSEWYLRVFIDSDNGISIDDCENVSKLMNPLLDKCDFIDSIDFFEVSSPGIERSLKTKEHFEKFMGSKIKVKLFAPIDNQKNLTGILESYDNGNIVINVENKKINIEADKLSSAKIVYEGK